MSKNEKMEAAEFANDFMKKLGLPGRASKVKKRKNGAFEVTFDKPAKKDDL